MNNIHFENVVLDDESRHFLFVGEIKAHGLNHFAGQALARRTGAPYNAVSLVPDTVDYAPFGNIAVINPRACLLAEREGRPVAGRSPMDAFAGWIAESDYVDRLLDALEKRQERVPAWMFESKPVLAAALGDRVTLVGPDPQLVHDCNDKLWQYEHLGRLVPVVDFRVCDNGRELEDALRLFLDGRSPGAFVTRDRSAGGVDSMVARSAEEALERFGGDGGGRHLVSRYTPHAHDPTVLGVVGNERQVYVAGVADMHIVDGNKFRGSTYPSTLPDDIQKRLMDHTETVGRELGRLGFRGIYGCDYIVTQEGGVFFIEVNPRKQGTTMEFCCTLEALSPEGALSLFDMEAGAVLDGAFPEDAPQPDARACADGRLYWGTFNHKCDDEAVTIRAVQQEDERALFARAAKGRSGHVVLEHVGAGVAVKPGTFLGRAVAVGPTRDDMRRELDIAKQRLQDSIAE